MHRPRALYYSILNYAPGNLEMIQAHFDLVELPDPSHDTPSVLGSIEALFAPLGFNVDAAKMAACPNLQVVISNTTSIPHIDRTAAAQRGIRICALHDEQAFLETITPTAEHTIGLMIALQRRIPAAHADVLAGEWSRWKWGAPKMLSRMQLGLVGYGRLGRRVARIAETIGMAVSFYDPNVAGGFPSLLELARTSDVLSLHASATAENRHLVSERILRALPRGALLINTARGELLDTQALLTVLREGHLGGAALDTIDGEFESGFAARFASSPLARYARERDNLILTPHIGGSTLDAWAETQERVIRKAIQAFEDTVCRA